MAKFFDQLKTSISKFANKKPQPVKKSDRSLVQSKKLAEDAKNIIESFTSELGPRPAATKESRRAARKIASCFEEYSEDVLITSARAYNKLNFGMLVIGLILMFFMYVFSIFNMPYLSLIIGCFYAWCLYREVRGKGNFFRRFLSSGESANVHAVLEPENEVKSTVMFSAHHDSAPILGARKGFSSQLLFSYVIPVVSFIIMLITGFVLVVFDVVKLSFKPGLTYWPFLVFSTLSEALSLLSLFSIKYQEKSYSPGAGDNLSGVSVVTELLKYFSSEKESGRGLKNTRLVFASFDAEECGLQGSSYWFRDNSHILINAKVINFDGLYKANELAFTTSDGNGLVQLSTPLARHLSELAYKMGYKVPIGKLSLLDGETDAASASRAGFDATTLTSMRPEILSPAHTIADTPDKIETEALNVAISVAIKYVENTDDSNAKKEDGELRFLNSDRKYIITK